MPRKAIGTQATHELLRAFLALAESLNLTEASEALGLTRQTVRRYIDVLEEMKGAPLFALQKNSYVLTPLGEASLPEARFILTRTARFCSPASGEPGASSYLSTSTFFDDEGRDFHLQQHPVSSLASKACPLLQKAFAAWASAKMRLEAAEMRTIRPYLLVYRDDPQGWRCMEIGDRSAYARWFGWAWSKSAVGKLSYEDEAGDEFDRVVSDTYKEVFGHGGARLDHIFAHLARQGENRPLPVTFQRLLMACNLPDGTRVIAVLTAITNDIEIAALGPDWRPLVHPSLEMKHE